MWRNTPDDFWNKLRRNHATDCLMWTGWINKTGNGFAHYHGRTWLAHRLAWTLTHGPIPPGLCVCHSCDVNWPPGDTTYRACCNPAHLWLGTHAENKADCVQKGRQAKGDRQGLRVHPDRAPRGDRHMSRTKPEALRRGDTHPYRLRPELVRHGQDQSGAKLHDDEVRAIRSKVAQGHSIKELAAAHGVTYQCVWQIAKRRSWRHIP